MIEPLDVDELLQLTVQYMSARDHAKAIEMSKRAVEIAPNDPRTHFFLAAEYAEIGLEKRAVEGFTKTLELDPDHVAARLQLGLMRLFVGDRDAARLVWAPLEKLGDEAAPQLFSRAMLLLMNQESLEGLAVLRRAIAAEHADTPFRRQMARWAEILESKLSDRPDKSQAAGHAERKVSLTCEDSHVYGEAPSKNRLN